MKERELAAQDTERALAEDNFLRELGAISQANVRVNFNLAKSTFPDDANKAMQLAEWLCQNPDASPIEIMKYIRKLKA